MVPPSSDTVTPLGAVGSVVNSHQFSSGAVSGSVSMRKMRPSSSATTTLIHSPGTASTRPALAKGAFVLTWDDPETMSDVLNVLSVGESPGRVTYATPVCSDTEMSLAPSIWSHMYPESTE